MKYGINSIYNSDNIINIYIETYQKKLNISNITLKNISNIIASIHAFNDILFNKLNAIYTYKINIFDFDVYVIAFLIEISKNIETIHNLKNMCINDITIIDVILLGKNNKNKNKKDANIAHKNVHLKDIKNYVGNIHCIYHKLKKKLLHSKLEDVLSFLGTNFCYALRYTLCLDT